MNRNPFAGWGGAPMLAEPEPQLRTPRAGGSRGQYRRTEILAGRTDWGCMLENLRTHGVSTREVARRIDVPHRTVSGWALGEPTYDDGARLVALWCQTLGLQPEARPRRR